MGSFLFRRSLGESAVQLWRKGRVWIGPENLVQKAERFSRGRGGGIAGVPLSETPRNLLLVLQALVVPNLAHASHLRRREDT
jgi:hypothetical protein